MARTRARNRNPDRMQTLFLGNKLRYFLRFVLDLVRVTIWDESRTCQWNRKSCCASYMCLRTPDCVWTLQTHSLEYLTWPFPQHAARAPSLSINRGSTEELIEILLTVQYTNSWPLIPIIPAYRIVINHSQPCKYKSFHLSLCCPENNCCILSWEVFPGVGGAGAAALGTLICSYSGSARGGSFCERAAPSPTWQTRRLIRPLQPPSDKTLERLVFRLQASNFRLADVRRGGRLTGVWRFAERNGACLFAFNSDSLQENVFLFIESARVGRGTNRDREGKKQTDLFF